MAFLSTFIPPPTPSPFLLSFMGARPASGSAGSPASSCSFPIIPHWCFPSTSLIHPIPAWHPLLRGPAQNHYLTILFCMCNLGPNVLPDGEGNGTPLQYSCLETPWTEEPGRLQSMGSLRVGHDGEISLSLFTCMHWRRKWQPTPVFLPGESQGWESLMGCHLWGRTESDTTEVTQQHSSLVGFPGG